MRPNFAPHFRLVVLIAAAIVVADQAAKWLVRTRLGPDDARHVARVAGVPVRFVYTENTGVAFGALTGGGRWLAALVLLAAVGFVLLIPRTGGPSTVAAIACALVLGGAIGNLIDRVRFGHVIDFIDAGRWPAFNIADASITIGTITLLVRAFTADWRSGSGVAAGEQTFDAGVPKRG